MGPSASNACKLTLAKAGIRNPKKAKMDLSRGKGEGNSKKREGRVGRHCKLLG